MHNRFFHHDSLYWIAHSQGGQHVQWLQQADIPKAPHCRSLDDCQEAGRWQHKHTSSHLPGILCLQNAPVLFRLQLRNIIFTVYLLCSCLQEFDPQGKGSVTLEAFLTCCARAGVSMPPGRCERGWLFAVPQAWV